MSAKEMFEKLGYKQLSNDNIAISYKNNFKKDKVNYMVVFYFSDNNYQIFKQSYSTRLLKENLYLPIYEPYRVSKELHEAINKQVEELGWLDEK